MNWIKRPNQNLIILAVAAALSCVIAMSSHLYADTKHKDPAKVTKSIPTNHPAAASVVAPASEQPLPNPKDAMRWVLANQATFAWDRPTTYVTGDPIPPDADIKYQVWWRQYSVSSGEKVGPETSDQRATITFTRDSSVFVGIQALRYQDAVLVATSDVAWSDNPVVCQNQSTFGFRYFVSPALATGLRPQ